MYQNNPNSTIVTEKKTCYFCKNNVSKIDYKDSQSLRRFLNSQAKIYPPKRFGTCSKHQRMLVNAIKRSRIMGMLPFVVK